MINVGIIDPDNLSRKMVRMLLTNQTQQDITITFEVDKLPSIQSTNDFISPHLVLLDLKSNTPRLIKSVKSMFPKTSILK